MLNNAIIAPALLPFQELEQAVWKKDLCAGCRGCITVCPANTLAYDQKLERPYQITPCIDCKACLEACPRIPLNMEKMPPDVLGPYIQMKSVRAKAGNSRYQNGGAVTALLKAALQEELVDRAVVMGVDRWDHNAYPLIINDVDGLERAAGSKYTTNGILEAMRGIIKDESIRSVALVGTPCTVQAIGLLRKSSNEYAERLAHKVRFLIGLFCFESFDASLIPEVSRRIGVPSWRIAKMNAGEGKLTVALRSGEVRALPLSSLTGLVRPGCFKCNDFTSRLADVSVGSVGSAHGSSALIVRTPEGAGLLEIAEENGLIEATGGVDVAAIEKVGKLKLKKNGL
ncbi:Coenzyme F420 hydrogenase/dehydrogenase, beta subunit C-terminal domain [Methanocella conradii]|uniref:Coenzyme F420 hydrogenase/dehydrogenase, beta subunit C-terminal domain n=1 Tax=Methanocella conradii TaxID=1175444 RepID=UPI0024B38E5B|nr:Coenzyme F420 hydrogenase/dehydrogenase, beta subunit C-terminal domain [Methanocella conradii]MDI6897294.1 Coenzyme F420 hydrogenase/dehydrogenase, beta subunit C-terminal domain [Methanocella conradii]